MKNDKKLVILFLSITAVFMFAFCAIVWFVDPLKIYHAPFICKDEIYSDMRVAAVGELKRRDYDSLIMGTSILENSSSMEASQKLGGKFINISLSGSNLFERSIVLDFALRQRKISKILYSLDTYHMIARKKDNSNFPLSNYDFLYDKNPLNDIKIYTSDDFLSKIFTSKRECYKSDFDRPNAWFRNKAHDARFGGLQNWIANKDNPQMQTAFKLIEESATLLRRGEISKNDNEADFELTKIYLNETLLNYVKKYPNTEFIVIVPPYSRIFNAMDYHTLPKTYSVIKHSIAYLVDFSAKFKNLKIYAWGDTDYPDEIANYKDLTHYSHKFNSQMLSYIKDGVGILSSQNFNAYYSKFEEKSANFDLIKFQEQIQKLKNNALESEN